MRLTVRGKGIEVTTSLRAFVTRKLKRLDRYFQEDQPLQATLSIEKDRHIVELTLAVDGRLLRGEESGADMYASVDLAVDKLERQIHKYKTVINRKLRRDGSGEPVVEIAVPEPEQLVRTKRFSLKPIPVEEALLQMELLGHDFFVFTNAETEQVNVVYRRKGGNYGLIEPDN